MGEAALVESQIADSFALVRTLDKAGNNPSVAMWYYYPDSDEWRLLIAGPAFDALLPKEEARAYLLLVNALAEAGVSSLSIGEVKIIRMDDPILEAARFLIRTEPNAIVRGHFKNNRIKGIYIKEMLVLRAA